VLGINSVHNSEMFFTVVSINQVILKVYTEVRSAGRSSCKVFVSIVLKTAVG
jgi:acyl-CoA hydrolase